MGEQTWVNSYRGREGSKLIITIILILTCDLDDCKGVKKVIAMVILLLLMVVVMMIQRCEMLRSAVLVGRRKNNGEVKKHN